MKRKKSGASSDLLIDQLRPLSPYLTPYLDVAYKTISALERELGILEREVGNAKRAVTNAHAHLSAMRKVINSNTATAIEAPKLREPGAVPTSDEPITVDTKIEDVLISVRLYNVLKNAGISTIGDVMKRTRPGIQNIKSLGMKSFVELQGMLYKAGLSLRER